MWWLPSRVPKSIVTAKIPSTRLHPRRNCPDLGSKARALVESRFKEQVDEQVKSSLVMDSLEQVTKGDHFSAIGEPDFDFEAITLPDEGDLVYEFRIEVRPDFATPQWEGLQLERPVCEITNQHVDEHLSRTLTRLVPGEAVDGACRVGDSVTLSAVFQADGKQIADFEEEKVIVRQKLTFGDARIEGFDKLITGKSEGDRFTATFQLSESAANEQLRGKAVTAEFEIIEIRRINIDDMSASALEGLGFDDVGELREFIRKELEQQFHYHQQQALRKQIVKLLTADANWELPSL